MFFEVTLITAGIVLICIGASCFYNAYKKYKYCTMDKMSFADSLSLCNLPVVCFKCSGKNFNLLVDSGANNNLVDINILDQFEYEVNNKYRSIMKGIEGNEVTVPFVNMTIEYKGNTYSDMFQAVDVSKLFGGLNRENGVIIHGLLGNNFFQKYKYILDFDELTFYHV